MFRKVKWNHIANKVKNISPDIFSMISTLCEKYGDDFYLLKYAYGEKIISSNGIFELPNKLTISEVSKSISEELGYAGHGVPLGMVISGQCEIFTESYKPYLSNVESVNSLGLYRTGDFIGFNSLLTCQDERRNAFSEKSLQMTAGARTAFMTAGVKNSCGFNRLRKMYNGLQRLDKPNTIYDHWSLFRHIANHADFKSAWHAELIIFPVKLANAIKSLCLGLTSENHQLMNLIFNKANLISSEAVEAALWENLLGHYSQYSYALIEKAKQILLGGLGRLPLYHINNNDEAGPFTELAKIFSETYQWEKYAPIIMKPTYIDWTDNATLYCTLNPVFKNNVNITSHRSSASEAIKIKSVISQIMKRVKQFPNLVKNSALKRLPTLNITFHHYDLNKTDEMLPSNMIFKDEKEAELWLGTGKQPAYSNSFLRCCAKVTRTSDSSSNKKILNEKLESIGAWEV